MDLLKQSPKNAVFFSKIHKVDARWVFFTASKIYRYQSADPFLARLKMLHFQNACLAAKELLKASNCFTQKNNSPKKLAKAASSGGNFAILVQPPGPALGMGPFAANRGFCWPDLVGRNLSDLHTLWSRKNLSSGCEPCSTQGFCVSCLIYLNIFVQRIVVFNEENALLKHGTRRFANFGGFEVFNGPPREVDSTQQDATGPAGFSKDARSLASLRFRATDHRGS